MGIYHLIKKKRDGGELTQQELQWLIHSYLQGDMPDSQMAALLMAIYFVGMTDQEMTTLTQIMVASGSQLNIQDLKSQYIVDKHSTGGVGDKISLIVCPWVAAAGVTVPKMSGRGLGHTGGTVDKLESFPNINVELSTHRFLQIVQEVGVAIVSQTQDLVPADKVLYALRDRTATVDSIPLIASSIMSKKIASGAPALVLDVKVGCGAFMSTMEQAQALAKQMRTIGEAFNMKVTVVISQMNQPLGYTIGNILEVKEAIAVLNGNGPSDLTDLCLTIGAEMLILSGISACRQEAKDILERVLASGKGVLKLAEMVGAQGGDQRYVYEPDRFLRARYVQKVRSDKSGYITQMDALILGMVSNNLGSGRLKAHEPVDLTAGIEFTYKRGDWVNTSDIIALIHTNDKNAIEVAIKEIKQAIVIDKEPPLVEDLVCEIISE